MRVYDPTNRTIARGSETRRTLRGFADELKSVPAIAAQFAGYVEQMGNLITG